MNYKNIHPSFKWQGKKLTQKEILQLAQEFSLTDEEYLQQIGAFFKAWFNQNPLIEVQTSGSTGKPKKMKVKKEYMLNSALATQDFFDLPEKTTALLCLPASYIAGKLMLVRALCLGWELDFVKPQANPLAVFKKKYDFSAFTPYQLTHSLADLPLLKKLMVGGGAVSNSLWSKIQNVSTEIYETYAMTETLTHIAARKINHNSNVKLPAFQLLKDVEIDVDDRSCLIIKAPKVSDEIIFTNDIVEIETSTSFRLKGRFDNIINSGGIKIIPEEIENKISKLIKNRFFITGIPDDILGEKLILVIENPDKNQQINSIEKELKNSADLKKYEIPKEIYLLSNFEETHTGKINQPETLKKIL